MLRVRDCMTQDVTTLGPHDSAAEAWALCRRLKIRHIPVVEEGNRLLGLVSDRDLRDVSPAMGGGFAPSDRQDALGRVALESVMTRDLEVAHPLDTIDHAARRIYDLRIGCLPVVADGELAGIITSSDMMRTLTGLIGAHGAGSWVEAEVEHQPGKLAEVTDVLRNRHVNIASVFLTPAHRTDYRTIVLRLDTTNPQGIVESLREAGYTARAVESTAPLEITHEEK